MHAMVSQSPGQEPDSLNSKFFLCSSEISVFLNKGHIMAMDNWFLVLVSPY
jgi:hypothetical protein